MPQEIENQEKNEKTPGPADKDLQRTLPILQAARGKFVGKGDEEKGAKVLELIDQVKGLMGNG